MPRRSAALIPLIVLILPTVARAHRLDAEYRVLPNQHVRVECWFETGDSAKGASVQVFRPNGQLLVEGKLDDNGQFVFDPCSVEGLKVVINASGGHRKELLISPHRLNPAASPDEGEVPPGADRSSPVTFKDIVVGVGFLLAAAAFFLSLRNAQRLKEIGNSSAPPSPPSSG